MPRFPSLPVLLMLGTSLLSALADPPAPLAPAAHVASFSPQGEIHQIRQVTASFSEPMVAFGDPRTIDPFDIQCSEPGHGHWADPRHWLFDFDRDVPGDTRCSFAVRAGLLALSGAAVAPARFGFNTGGPEVRKVFPVDGEEAIDERQSFLLGLSAAADVDSVRAKAWCSVEGISERIPVELIEGQERAQLLEREKDFAREFFLVLGKRGTQGILALKDSELQRLPVSTLRCARPLPSGRKVSLVWGAGIKGRQGLVTGQDQAFAYQVRPEFRASLSCTRMTQNGNCIPVAPLTLTFTSPVAREFAAAIRVHTADGARHAAVLDSPAQVWEQLSFPGPFPASSDLTIELPTGLHDDAGRPLANAGDFPLRVRIDPAPPLIKFSANFGILEANAEPTLPVAVRNVEPHAEANLSARLSAAPKGTVARLTRDDDQAIARWYLAVTQGAPAHRHRRTPLAPGADDAPLLPGESPLLDKELGEFAATPITLPPTRGDHNLELIGVPLPKPGLYIVEFASPRLGAALLAKPAPYYVHAGALVTNLSIHFKLGRESSLAWVTRLDNAQPVAGAEVHVSDCTGHLQWQGKTDSQGIANIATALPEDSGQAPECPGYDSAKLVTARSGDDLSFMYTHWNEGIRSWQFNLPWAAGSGEVAAHTVTDRPLFRAGETVSMKHFFRLRTGQGFASRKDAELPGKLILRHEGSDETYELALAWRDGHATSRWKIPTDAKLGTYQINLEGGSESYPSGNFRVEQYRVPLMRAALTPPAAPPVRPASVRIDAQLSYLAGGPAGDAVVKVRSRLEPTRPYFPDYPDFHFDGALPKEGTTAETPYFEVDPEAPAEDDAAPANPRGQVLRTQQLALDRAGGRRIVIDHLPRIESAQTLEVEMEYLDPNGAIQTAATQIGVLPSAVVLGIRTGTGFAPQDQLGFRVVALDPEGKPLAGQQIEVEAWRSKTFGYRKRLLGGFYSYEQNRETHRLGPLCRGRTDAQGLLFCAGSAPEKGELTLVARASDRDGNPSIASASFYVAGEDDWFSAGASDRMDLLADRLAYEPGQTAHIQVRMPFREATALVAVEREGVLSTQTVHLRGKSPTVDVPILASYGPNTYISVLAVRGRIDPEQPGMFAWLKRMVWRIGRWLGLGIEVPLQIDTRPTALVDLTRPAFRLGLIPVKVGWQGYALKVKVDTDRQVYRVRDHVQAHISVTDNQGKAAAHATVALAAVDEGLLALAPATSWDLLEAMMAPRGLAVETSTAQSQVVGRRHFGKKAAAPGGGGGEASARELFDTLLAWRGDVVLDAKGQATIDIPLNDSLSAFRIAAIAAQGAQQFGSGSTSIRTSQDVMLFAGVAPFVREGDRFNTLVTVRNASNRTLDVDVHAATDAGGRHSEVGKQSAHLDAGQAQTLSFANRAPSGAATIDWTIDAQVRGEPGPGSSDRLKVSQQVGVAVPVRVLERTLEPVSAETPLSIPVKLPEGAMAGLGGIDVQLANSLGGDRRALQQWFQSYPYQCIEQQASRAVALGDRADWDRVMGILPAYLDGDGLVRYFPAQQLQGDDTLTSYLLAIAHEAGYPIPEILRGRMLRGLAAFVEGRVQRYGALPSADLMLRRLTALEALARYDAVSATMLGSLDIAPDRWPSSALLDWISLLGHVKDLKDRDARLEQARAILRARLIWSGTLVSFSTEKSDALWWLMVSPDLNAVRALRLLIDDPAFRADLPRLARGALQRQSHGHWTTTLANAWGVLALRAFHDRFEHDPVNGVSHLKMAGTVHDIAWAAAAKAGTGVAPGSPFATPDPALGAHWVWPAQPDTLTINHAGSGRPWAFVTSSAAVPLTRALQTGMRLQRSVAAVEQKANGRWTRGDIYEVTLDLETEGDETWVAIDDPVPAGATILGSGLGGETASLADPAEAGVRDFPAFVERRAERCVAYFAYLPKGHHVFRYRARLNSSGQFSLPPSHVEAMYAPERMALLPVAAVTVVEP